MKYLFITLLVLCSCSATETEKRSAPWPSKITNLDNQITVSHSPDTVFATLNTKDPEKWGKYQLQFTTSVSAQQGNITITEFGAYRLVGENWLLSSIYDRPFNAEEFVKWYNCENGVLLKGKTYADTDNWIAKADSLSGRTEVTLWYYIGVDEAGNKVVGAKEVVGVLREK